MRVQTYAAALASAVAAALVPTTGHGQTLQRMQVSPVLNSAGDVATAMATVTFPSLQASMPSVAGGEVTVQLRGVWVSPGRPGSQVMVQATGTANVQVSSSPAAGKYHVRFNFTLPSPTQSSSVQIHSGQQYGDPVAATCTVTAASPHCDVIVNSPGGAFYLTATVNSGAPLDFNSVTMAPTP